MTYPGIMDCPSCGKPDSAYEYSFCGKCEERYQKEMAENRQRQKADAEERAAKRNAEMIAAGAEFGICYAKQDELGNWYVARGEV